MPPTQEEEAITLIPLEPTSERTFTYEISGRVAHARISPLLPSHWIDRSIYASVADNKGLAHVDESAGPGENGDSESNANSPAAVDFLWENAPRHHTKEYRDKVSVYSHLPNGCNILDSKWVLGRLLVPPENDDKESSLSALETHCFRGSDGFKDFAKRVGLMGDIDDATEESLSQDDSFRSSFPDIIRDSNDEGGVSAPESPPEPKNLWVVKDAMSNGAGGIWIVGPETAISFLEESTSPLFPDHRYVAQRYAWPPVLYDGKKCHVRAYGMFACDGRVFLHKRAFLHVANDTFRYLDDGVGGVDEDATNNLVGNAGPTFRDSVHITNCCANSHDSDKFAGEILADMEAFSFYNDGSGNQVVPLGQFFPSMKACLSNLADQAGPYLQGGEANNGFEYLGLDFILSYRKGSEPSRPVEPVAYLLEVNAPPSQDTATGLPHAENLHDEVIRDLLSLWVIPNVDKTRPIVPGGWRCVRNAAEDSSTLTPGIIPSKAAIINKIRWAIFERKALKEEQNITSLMNSKDPDNGTHNEAITALVASVASSGTTLAYDVSAFARSQFPYISDISGTRSPHDRNVVFFENAGGSQVPKSVVESSSRSLGYRNRSMIGAKEKEMARKNMISILGVGDGQVYFGANATSLLSNLASTYVKSGMLKSSDEIVISGENHLANVIPWIDAAQAIGATVKWWLPFGKGELSGNQTNSSANLADLISPTTRIVAVPHASNVLGQIRCIKEMAREIKQRSSGHAHVIVDGVAAAPHWNPRVSDTKVDWYVVSCHKLFGPHVGVLSGRSDTVRALDKALSSSRTSASNPYLPPKSVRGMLELGTISYEACAGLNGLSHYFGLLATFNNESREATRFQPASQSSVSSNDRPLAWTTRDIDTMDLSAKMIDKAYQHIRAVEAPMVELILGGLAKSEKVRVIESKRTELEAFARLPVVSFVHDTIPVRHIYNSIKSAIVCRHSAFLSTPYLARAFDFDQDDGVLRVSLAHYNAPGEVEAFLQSLERIPGWF